MKIILLGATGRVGSHILDKLISDNHQVHALVRSPEKVEIHSDLLTMYQGDAVNGADIRQAMAGCDAVISALNTDKTTVLSESTPLMIHAMKELGLKRIITIGTAGILQARSEPEHFRYQTNESKRKSTFAAEEHRKAYEFLKESDLEWTVVCPTYLPDGEEVGGYRVSKTFLPIDGRKIHVPDAAAFAYKQLFTNEFIRERVGIAY